MKPTKELLEYAELMTRIGAPVLIDFQHPKLEALMSSPQWDAYSKLFDKDERRCIRYYRHHRRGDCTYSPDWTPFIESARAKIEAHIEHQKNLRWVVRDQATGLYWATIINPPYWRKLSKAFLFIDEYPIRTLVNRTNRKLGKGSRIQLVQINAKRRLSRSPF